MLPVSILIDAQFLSTLSLRRATAPPYNLMIHQQNFYPRSPCGERQAASVKTYHWIHISIHALLAESDKTVTPMVTPPSYISIHALLAESDGKPKALKSRLCVFLSTLSLRRATVLGCFRFWLWCYFYPRSPCGERPASITPTASRANFYPRSPCGERRKHLVLGCQ